MSAYYNEIDPHAAQWLRNLIKAGHIAHGVVDERSIEDVHPDELREFTQCHWFAGIGAWSFALRRAGWPDSRPVWTGSCPCQPFSAAGSGAGFADERHLWPSFAWLIEQRRPPIVFGEQVASKAVEPWIDLVHADLEAMGYAFGAIPFPSAGVGAPHIRDRLFWVADSLCARPQKQHGQSEKSEQACATGFTTRSGFVRLADTDGQHEKSAGDAARSRDSWWCREAERLGNAYRQPAGRNTGATHATETQHGSLSGDCDGPRNASRLLSAVRPAGPVNGFWGAADWLRCRDDKWRPVEPSTFPLVDGAASRVVRLRAYGNAINAEAATQFIGAYLDQ